MTLSKPHRRRASIVELHPIESKPDTRRRSFIAAALGVLAMTVPSGASELSPLAGLWHGTAQVGLVSAVGSEDALPAAGMFNLPVLIHVGTRAQAYLLKEIVILPQENGTLLLPDPFKRRDVLEAQPEALLRQARRIVSAGHDFDGARLRLAGSFSPGATLMTRITTGPDSRTNPFGHAYHPDHDNLDDQDLTRSPLSGDAEIYRVTRSITVELPEIPENVSGQVDELAGEPFTRIVGVYSETVEGLATGPITARGRLFLTRIDPNAELVE